MSANARSVWNNPAAKTINYNPQDNAEIYANDPSLKELRNDIGKQFQGGQFSAKDFCGDVGEID